MKTVQAFLFSFLLVCAYSLQAQNNALNFDGSDDYVTVPASASYNLTSGTIECLVKPSALGDGLTLLGVRGPGGTRYSFHMRANSIGLWNGAVYFPITYTFNVDTWYHFAFVCDASTTKTYINGTYVGEFNYVFSNVTGQDLVIGAVKESGTASQLFAGSIDEVRLWNTARTLTEILDYKNISLSGSETGLVGLFSFDHGTPSGANSIETTLLDKTAAHNNGTLNNFSLTGATSNYVTSSLSPGVSSSTAWLAGGNAGTSPVYNYIGTNDNNRLSFRANDQEKMTILPNGNIGIGTSNPTSNFTIKQQTDGVGIQFQAPVGPYSSNYLNFGTVPGFPQIYSMWSNGRLDISSGQELFLFGNTIYLSGNTVVTRIGDPTSLATSKSSRTMPFEANVWNGTNGSLVYAGVQNIASTTTNLAHRLAFKLAAANPDLNDGTEAFTILSSGNIGVGIVDPKVKFAVNGEIKSTKLTVTASPWADFVFDKSYKLRSLPDVEKFILKNKHLPEIPTAAEVSKEGIDVGTQQALLLQKLEEVTLYLIEQYKINAVQQQEINELKKILVTINK